MESEKYEYVDFLPVGSVIILRGNVRKLIIIARGVMSSLDDTSIYFDYAGVLYPDGLISDRLLYFNHSDIMKVVFKGFSDEDEILMKDNINHWIMDTHIKKGNPYDILRRNNE